MASALIVDFGLLKRNVHFRAVFVARMMSVFSLGILAVAVPVQIQQLTGSTLQVSLAVALDGVGVFVGLMVGGVAADRYDRRRQILLARGLCGVGFLALALNGFLAAPSVAALYLVALWDGFFGAIGMTALMAAIPGLVGRENLPAAGALSMLTVRFGAVLAPMVGGLIIASTDVSWNYLVAGLGTLGTLIPLVHLPTLRPDATSGDNPLRALFQGFGFVLQNRIVGAVMAVGLLQESFTAIRVVFPALAGSFAAGPVGVGMMYSAVPLGAMIGAVTSGWVGGFARPGRLLVGCVCGGAALVAALGLASHLAPALVALVLLGYLGSIASLLQFTLVQTHTPDHLLGRLAGLRSGQDVVGESGGALLMGALARLLTPAFGVVWFGAGALATGLAMAAGFANLRALRGAAPPKEPAAAPAMAGQPGE